MKNIIVLLLVCLSFVAGAQTKRQQRLDSLRIALSNAKEDTNKVKLLLRVGNNLANSNADNAIEYAKDAKATAKRLNDTMGMAAACHLFATIFNNEGKYNKALKNYRTALKIYQGLGDKKDEGGALCNIGLTYSRMLCFNKALKYYNEAKAILQEIDYKPFLAQTIIDIGGVYIKKTEYVQAADYYKQGLEIYKAIDNKKGMADSYCGLALIYLETQEYANAEDAAVQALTIAKDAKYKIGINYANTKLDEIHAITQKIKK